MNTVEFNKPRKTLSELINESGIDAVIVTDIQGVIFYWNNVAEVMLGKTKADSIGLELWEVIPSMQADQDLVEGFRQANEGMKSFLPSSIEHAHRSHIEIHIIPLKEDAELRGVLFHLHDVSHRVKAENELQFLNAELRERIRQISVTSNDLATFTYVAGKEVKEPIRKIYTTIENLIRVEASKLTNNGRAAFRRIQSALGRIDRQLDAILTLSEITILERPTEHVNISNVAKEVIAGMQERITEENVEIKLRGQCELKAHPNQLSLLLHHLLDNAIKFNTQHEKVVTIDCSSLSRDEAVSLGLPPGEYVDLVIADNGIGFHENDKERIFELFTRLHEKGYKGSGIGLAVVKKIMQAHGGYIFADATEGAGSEFRCIFPM